MTFEIGFVAANRDHFNASAEHYDDSPQATELARRSSRAIRRAYQFDEENTTVMDFACGPGLISRELAPYAKSIVGVDISPGMVDQYNTRVANQGIPREEMRAVCADLQGTADELDGEKFDLVVCASSYHHFASINDVTRTLAYFLKPNAVLLVIDLLKSDDAETEDLFPDHVHHVVAHKGGFKEDDLRTAFREAGLTAFMFNDAMTVKRRGYDLKLFIAKGTKPILTPGQFL